jgi:hypothetical protein
MGSPGIAPAMDRVRVRQCRFGQAEKWLRFPLDSGAKFHSADGGSALVDRDPGHKQDYDQQLQALLASLQPLEAEIARLRGTFAGTPVPFSPTSLSPFITMSSPASSVRMDRVRPPSAVPCRLALLAHVSDWLSVRPRLRHRDGNRPAGISAAQAAQRHVLLDDPRFPRRCLPLACHLWIPLTVC